MALFGKKKKADGNIAQTAENTQSNSVTDELKIIMEAREEEQQEREAKALERQLEQDAATKQPSATGAVAAVELNDAEYDAYDRGNE